MFQHLTVFLVKPEGSKPVTELVEFIIGFAAIKHGLMLWLDQAWSQRSRNMPRKERGLEGTSSASAHFGLGNVGGAEELRLLHLP